MSYVIEIVAIGNEILSGVTLNTNATFLSQELVKLGLEVKEHRVLSDERAAILAAFSEMLEKNDLILCTGGLGPTLDDITRNVIAELFESDFIYNEEIAEDLKLRFGSCQSSIIDQATVPRKAEILRNHVGTAPGLIFKGKRATLILMPGVPSEMHVMWQEEVLPYLREILPSSTFSHRRLSFCKLKEIDVDPLLRQLKNEYPKIDFGIYPSLGLLFVSLKIAGKEEQLIPAYNKIKESFKKNFFESPQEKTQEAIQRALINKKKTLSLAESCTGGALGAALTEISGASDYFKGSIVSYSNEIKENILSVPHDLIVKYGAVSQECVKEMAIGALKLMNTDYAIAISGIAGPTGGSEEKPVGTVYYCIASKEGNLYTWGSFLRGSREMVIRHAVNEALGTFLMREIIN